MTIVEKRIEGISSSSRYGKRSYTYYVTFKFPDGLEKELNVKTAIMYNDLEKGDTGMISYKETKNNTRKLGGRLFIDFEKDS